MSKFPSGNVEALLIAGDPDSSYTYPVEIKGGEMVVNQAVRLCAIR